MLKKIVIWVLPILRQVLLMALEKQIQQTLYGKPTTRRYDGYRTPMARKCDGRYMGPKFPATPPITAPKPRYTDPITTYFEQKSDADELLTKLRDVEHEYNRAVVADFLEFASFGETPTFSDSVWGWRDLSDCEVLIDPLQPRVWSLTLPRPVYLGSR